MLRFLADSSLPHPNQGPHVTRIGTALFHARHTAATGFDAAHLALILVALVFVGVAVLIAVRCSRETV